MKSIIVGTRKGGVGKTTLAVHLAWYFAEKKLRVLMIDLDGQANSSQTLAAYVVPGLTASRLFSAEALPAVAPARAAEDGDAIAVIAADRKLDDFGKSDAQKIIPPFVQHLATLGEAFDVCVVDTPPSAGICTIAAMIAGHCVVSPIDLETYSLTNIQSTIQEIQGITQKYNKGLRFLGVLPSRVDGRSAAQQSALTQLVRDFGHLVLPGVIREAEAIASVPRAKQAVWKLGTSSAREHGKAMRETLKLIEERVFA